jgi:hypothetical protein
MNTAISPEIKEIIDVVHYRPAVSVIMPFEPKMNLKTALLHSLKIAADKVELQLLDNYPGEMCTLMMQKLKNLINNLNFNTYKKSIAIFLSPVFEKVMYLDIAVEEKIIIDESFEIRDLVYSKKQAHKYLLLLLSNNESKIYLGNSDSFVPLILNTSKSADILNDVPDKVANFSDVNERKEILMHKFLHYIDNSLDIILNAYHLPLFVAGTERILGHFKKITKHHTAIIEYIQGNYEEASISNLKKILSPYISKWKKVKQKELLNILEEAAGKKKLAVGMKDVWHAAFNQMGRLLVVEKNYMYAAEHSDNKDLIYKAAAPYNKISIIKDAVDDVIERVLENGGDVEFAEKSVLKNYNHIALVQYY